ncbi:hypothetical protein GCM10007052_12950 [Halioglobus japonicus]|nr:hypothetical protein GCM10007052_12950 [Halioglobus japonicus]
MSTDFVDKSVGKVFNLRFSAVLAALITDWLKSAQTVKVYKKHVDMGFTLCWFVKVMAKYVKLLLPLLLCA